MGNARLQPVFRDAFNPFALGLLADWLIAMGRSGCSGSRAVRRNWVLLIVLLPQALLFECYYANFCPVKRSLSNANTALAIRTLEMLNRHQTVYWLEFGSLIAARRSQPPMKVSLVSIMQGTPVLFLTFVLMQWDPDSDVCLSWCIWGTPLLFSDVLS